MNFNGTDITNITQNPKDDYDPVWSNDSKNIYFVSTRTGTPELFEYSFDNSSTTQITNISTGINSPVLSPNGNLIAFYTKVYPQCSSDDNCNKELDTPWTALKKPKPSLPSTEAIWTMSNENRTASGKRYENLQKARKRRSGGCCKNGRRFGRLSRPRSKPCISKSNARGRGSAWQRFWMRYARFAA